MGKVLALIVMFIFMLSSTAFCMDSIYERDRTYEVVGWRVYVSDDDIDTTAELVTELDTTYAQLIEEDEVEVVSSSSADTTQEVTITGIDNKGKKKTETLSLNGTTADTSSTVWRYINQVTVNAECAGTVTVRSEAGDTFSTSIPIGKLDAQMAQHFNGEYTSYVTGWCAQILSGTGESIVELRWYPDDADSLDASDGYRVIDKYTASLTYSSLVPVTFAQPVKCPAGGWIAVYGTGSMSDQSVNISIEGYDVKQ